MCSCQVIIKLEAEGRVIRIDPRDYLAFQLPEIIPPAQKEPPADLKLGPAEA